jgi:hypothetical protein
MSDRKMKQLPRGFRKRGANRLGMEIPINLERILLEAARDGAFRERLLVDPTRAVAEGGFGLSSTEKAMLAAMDRSMIEAMVRRFGRGRSRKTGFAKGVAAAVAGSMVISVGTGCVQSAGIDPAPPEDATTEADVMVDFIDRPADGISEGFPDLTDTDDPFDEEGGDPDEDAADDAEEDSDG